MYLKTTYTKSTLIPWAYKASLLQFSSMHSRRAMFAMLLVIMSAVTTALPRKLLTDDFSSSSTLDLATEHQRILAELEEVHQLRERMLQQGEGCLAFLITLYIPADIAGLCSSSGNLPAVLEAAASHYGFT